MPDLFQSGAGEHSTYRSTAGLRDQTNDQADECGECRGGKARPEHGQEVGQRARYGGAGKHRRITLTRVVQKPSMLSPSPSKITDLDIPGASPRPADRVAPAKLRNTRGATASRYRSCRKLATNHGPPPMRAICTFIHFRDLNKQLDAIDPLADLLVDVSAARHGGDEGNRTPNPASQRHSVRRASTHCADQHDVTSGTVASVGHRRWKLAPIVDAFTSTVDAIITVERQ